MPATLTASSLSRSRIADLFAQIDAATPAERTEIRRQVAALRVARATGHGGSARQAGAQRAVLFYIDSK